MNAIVSPSRLAAVEISVDREEIAKLRGLYAAVIHQAIEDARSTNPIHAYDRQQARKWLTGRSRDFAEVCSLADLDPDAVRTAALRLIEQEPQSTRARRLTYNGETLTLTEWSERIGVNLLTIRARLARGLPTDRVLAPSAQVRRAYEANGEKHTLKEWAQISGISAGTLFSRLRNMSMQEALVYKRQPTWNPARNGRPCQLYTYEGKTLSIAQWAKVTGVSDITLRKRLRQGLSYDEVFGRKDRRTTGGRVKSLPNATRDRPCPAAPDKTELEFPK